ncbi:hypothetical protein N0V93_008104 [Gnomoniopsis smithogilvyi]|uniref:Alpha/beta hydrolase fold-3 domain-containing protein n=1 Tax=Gnomoniopsis smithogilvyi TaxID=1191159 RepID=A0A9W9CTK4_9PEZI|nr:hypothetical protein N0V93_008104 [Gnomoniopsis smithogilvyi]
MAEIEDPVSESSRGAIPLKLIKTYLAFLKRSITSPLRRSKGRGAPGYRRDVAYAFIRQLLAELGAKQVQFLTRTTDKMYNRITKNKGKAPNSVQLPEQAKGHWIGNPQARFVMLYSHGGGFFGSATFGHIRYLYRLQEEMAQAGHDFSIFVLTYTLSPNGVYPLQLKQAASALNYLLTEEHRDPATILLGGDSAGGNLTSALLEHIVRPHADVPPVSLARPLHAVLLISPWISFSTSWPTFESNAESDYISRRAINRAAITYIAPGSKPDAYSEPNTSPVDFWADVAKRAVQNLLIWGGGGEVLIDGIKDFAAKVSAGFAQADPSSVQDDGSTKRPPRFKLIVTPKCAHEEMIIDELALGWVKGGEAARDVESWLSAVLS